MVLDDPRAQKTALRRQALARRDALDLTYRAKASSQIAEKVLALKALRNCEFIGGYWPIRSEVDCLGLITALQERGHCIALPKVQGQEMRFHLWKIGDALEQGPFGLQEPFACSPVTKPQALLVPAVAFDERGGRIGYGKGFYDRYLTDFLGKAIGLAFAIQVVPLIPLEEHDLQLNCLITENRVLSFAQL